MDMDEAFQVIGDAALTVALLLLGVLACFGVGAAGWLAWTYTVRAVCGG